MNGEVGCWTPAVLRQRLRIRHLKQLDVAIVSPHQGDRDVRVRAYPPDDLEAEHFLIPGNRLLEVRHPV
jgi:hypothetical protein